MPSAVASSPARAESRITGTERLMACSRWLATPEAIEARHHHVGEHEIGRVL
jgi:hypothetical protein